MKRMIKVLDLGWRRRYLTAAALALASVCTFYVASAFGDAGNPILGTIRATAIPDASGPGVTVYVRGQWNWLSHNSDCNFDRAATGVGLIWNDPNSPGYTVTKGSITAGVGVQSSTDGNVQDQMVHPVDRGNVPQGYTAGTWTSTTQGYTTNTAGDYPQAQKFDDPTSPNPNSFASWHGGCGREPLTSVGPAGSGGLGAEGVNAPCAGGGSCSGHPWGSWGYEKNGGLGYSHHFASRSDVTTVCVNFYDVHGGGKFNSGKFQLVNGAKEITVNGNGDNSIQTNAFNVNQGANCITLPGITTSAQTAVTVGSTITDTATISGRAGLTSWVQFHLFLPGDTTCTGTDQYSGSRLSVSGNGSVTSSRVTTTQTGDYHWTAELFAASTGGTALAATSCNDSGETSTVGPAHPTIITHASGPVTIGVDPYTISDTATLSGGFNPTGTITFTAYAPLADGSADTQCTTSVFTSQAITVNGNGTYSSGSFTPTRAGTYEWVASYSGDANNAAVSTHCGDGGEQSVVNKHSSSVDTAQKVVITDFAKVTSTLGIPTGTVDFELFDTADCSGTPVFDSGPLTLDENGLADATTGSLTTTDPNTTATFYWLVSYTPSSGSTFSASKSACGVEHLTISGNTPGVDP